MIRIGWRSGLLAIAFVALVARRPGLLFTRGFFFVALVVGLLLFSTYTRRPRRDRELP